MFDGDTPHSKPCLGDPRGTTLLLRLRNVCRETAFLHRYLSQLVPLLHEDRMNKWLCGWILCFASLPTCAWATMYELPADGSAVVGADERTQSTYQDTLLDIARRYSVGYEEIVRANP